jgi:hypothetical protein
LRRRDSLIAFAFYAGFVPLLVFVPRWLRPDVTGLTPAAADGYDSNGAYVSALAWSVLGMIVFAARHRRARAGASLPAPQARHAAPATGPAGRWSRWIEILVVFAVFAAAYFPLFLARYAPYSEDQFFFATLHRMECGQVPYRDFAFLYGPLMIYPAWAWTQVFGFSMVSYFAYLAILEGVQFAVLIGVLQVVVPVRRHRYAVFLLLLPFLFDTLLGLNWNGTRRLLGVFVVLLACLRPYERVAQIGVAGLGGLHLAYSHEYALGGILGVLGMYALSFLRGEGWRAVRAAASIGIGSIVVWASVVWSLLGSAFESYIEYAREVAGKMAGGHANFTFLWTANSLALFGLLALACIIAGRGALQERGRALESGDRLLVCGLLNTLVVLKSGLGRCDLWHMDAAFLVLLVAFLLPLPAPILGRSRGEHRIACALVVVSSLTYLIGIAPTGSHYAAGYVRGSLDVVSGTEPTPAGGSTRSHCLEFERTHPRPQVVALGEFLAREDLARRPVFFFGGTWHLGPFLGVCRTDYPLDDLMYSEDLRPSEAYLRQHPEALVVLKREDYERLFEGSAPAVSAAQYWQTLTATKRLGRWLSTPHYDAKPGEELLKSREEDERVGRFIHSRYELFEEFEDYLLLRPK